MFDTVIKTKRIDVGNPNDLLMYDKILNNPNCTIIREIKEKLSDKEMGEEGAITSIKEYIILIVTYQEKVLLE